MRLTAARMFGLLDPSSERRKLTPLGRLIVDPRQQRGGRADAFLRVPLYAAIYERNKETVLPPEKTLEAEIVGLGIAEKQMGLALASYGAYAAVTRPVKSIVEGYQVPTFPRPPPART